MPGSRGKSSSGESGVKYIHPGVQTSDYVITTPGSVFVRVDSTLGPVTITPYTQPKAGDRLKVLDYGGDAGDNPINIDGLDIIGSNFGMREWEYDGSEYFLVTSYKNIFYRDPETDEILTIEQDTIVTHKIRAGSDSSSYAEMTENGFEIFYQGDLIMIITKNGIIAPNASIGDQAETKERVYSDFIEIGASVDADGVSVGNLKIEGENLSSYIIANSTPDSLVNLENAFDGSASYPGWVDFRGKSGQWHEFEFDEPRLVNRVKTNWYSDSFNYRGDSIRFEFSSDGVSWVGTEDVDTSGDLKGAAAGNFNGHNLVNNLPWKFMRYSVFGQGQEGVLMELQLFNSSYATMLNTVRANFDDSNIPVSELLAYDNNGTLIGDETKVLVEYTTDNGSNWSDQETLASFNESGTINSVGVFDVRFATVGAQRVKKIVRKGPSGFLDVSKNGFSFSSDGLKDFEFTKSNGVVAKGISLDQKFTELDQHDSIIAQIQAHLGTNFTG